MSSRSPLTKNCLVSWECATQVFYDKLVGIKYGTPEEGDASDKKPPDQQQDQARTQRQEDAPAGDESAQTPNSPGSDSSPVTQRPDTTADKGAPTSASSETVAGVDVSSSTGTSPTGKPAPVTPAAVGTSSTRVDGASSAAEKSAATVTPTVPPNAARPCVKSEGRGAAAGAATAEGPLRVSMRLSNEMPEFIVVTSKYEEAAGFQWRSEMHIQMAFMEEPGG